MPDLNQKLDVLGALLLAFARGELAVESCPELCDAIAAAARELRLPPNWQDPVWVAVLDQRIAAIKEAAA